MDLLSRAYDTLSRRPATCQIQDIPFSATSFEVLEAVRPLLVDQADRMTAQGLVMTVHGYAAARHYAADVFAAVELQVLRRRVDAFTPQGLAQLLLAFAAVGDPGVGLFDAMVESVIKQVTIPSLPRSFSLPFCGQSLIHTTVQCLVGLMMDPGHGICPPVPCDCSVR